MRRLPAFVAFAVLGCSSPREPHYPSSVSEPSGLARSSVHAGKFWVHPDSGNDPVLFLTDARGEVAATFELADARNVDWEDITSHDGFVYVGDHGNNNDARRDLMVYRIPEPAQVESGTLRPDATYPFHFPDQTEFGSERRRYDAEALVWHDDTLWLFSKQRADHRTRAYRFPALTSGVDVALEQHGEFYLGGLMRPFGGQVSGADVSADGTHLALLTYDTLFIFEWPPGAEPFDALQHRIDLDQTVLQQCEGIAWDGEDLLIHNEAREIFRVANALGDPPARFP